MKKILIMSNHFITLYTARTELIKKLLRKNYKVYLALPKSSKNDFFSKMGCIIKNTSVDRRGTNPINDLKLLFKYIKIISDINPDLIMTYTIKPNIYGGLASRITNSTILHTVTGLGSVYIQDIWQKNIVVFLNRIAFKKASKIFFLNENNKEYYLNNNIISKNHNTCIVPGSGVNLEKFSYKDLPSNSDVTFTFIGRILKDKGIEEFLNSAKYLNKKYKNVKFKVVGFIDEIKYEGLLKEFEKSGIIDYLGQRDDIPQIMADSSCIVLPSYGEGRGTVLQEGAAIGRPLITCDTYGCKENVVDGYNGYLCEVGNTQSLIKAMEKFLSLSFKEKLDMGKNSRKKAEKEFDRNIVINSYIKSIKKILN